MLRRVIIWMFADVSESDIKPDKQRVRSSETSLSVYLFIRCNIPEDLCRATAVGTSKLTRIK
jgi:hypothetical protein